MQIRYNLFLILNSFYSIRMRLQPIFKRHPYFGTQSPFSMAQRDSTLHVFDLSMKYDDVSRRFYQ
jgi:hypothetical protein